MNKADIELVDETLDAYVEWREECAEVRNAYRRWSTASPRDATDAFDLYLATLDNEEHAANLYARLISRIRQRAFVRPRNQLVDRCRRSPRS